MKPFPGSGGCPMCRSLRCHETLKVMQFAFRRPQISPQKTFVPGLAAICLHLQSPGGRKPVKRVTHCERLVGKLWEKI